jgi:alpha-N-arabinofuranosidase
MYTVHQDATLLPIALEGAEPRYEYDGRSLPAVSATASRDREGKIHITLTNLDPNRARTVSATLQGATLTGASGRMLTAGTMNAHNTFEQPHAVEPARFDAVHVSGTELMVELPPKSIVVLELR